MQLTFFGIGGPRREVGENNQRENANWNSRAVCCLTGIVALAAIAVIFHREISSSLGMEEFFENSCQKLSCAEINRPSEEEISRLDVGMSFWVSKNCPQSDMPFISLKELPASICSQVKALSESMCSKIRNAPSDSACGTVADFCKDVPSDFRESIEVISEKFSGIGEFITSKGFACPAYQVEWKVFERARAQVKWWPFFKRTSAFVPSFSSSRVKSVGFETLTNSLDDFKNNIMALPKKVAESNGFFQHFWKFVKDCINI